MVYDVVDAQGRVTETVEVGADGTERVIESHHRSSGERVVERIVERAGGERQGERLVERAGGERLVERAGGERLVERQGERSVERQGERSVERQGQRLVERQGERLVERAGGERQGERLVERQGERLVERAGGERQGERLVERAGGRSRVFEPVIVGTRAATLEPLLGGIGGEHRELFHRANLGSYIAAVTEQRSVTGVEAELQQALKLSTGGSSIEIPLALLARGVDGFEGRVPEHRADVVSTFPDTAAPKLEQTYTPAVFPSSLMARLAMIEVLSMGESIHVTMATSAKPAAVAPGADHFATAASWLTKIASPVRVPARFIYRDEDAARLMNVEGRLRMDMMAALQNEIDKLGVAGGSAELTDNGIIGALGVDETFDLSNVVNPAAATDAHRRAAYFALIDAGIDGLYGESMSDLSYYFTPPFYRAMLGMAHPDLDLTLHDALRGAGARLGGSQHVGNEALAADKVIGLIARARGILTAAILTVWPTVRLKRDEVTRAEKGEVVLTVQAMIDLTVPRAKNFGLLKTA